MVRRLFLCVFVYLSVCLCPSVFVQKHFFLKMKTNVGNSLDNSRETKVEKLKKIFWEILATKLYQGVLQREVYLLKEN